METIKFFQITVITLIIVSVVYCVISFGIPLN